MVVNRSTAEDNLRWARKKIRWNGNSMAQEEAEKMHWEQTGK